jgi:Fe-S cluster assembly protein SufD
MAIPNLDGNILYFINGVYNESLSTIVSPTDEVVILPLAEAIKSHADVIEKYFNQYADSADNAFTAVNTALLKMVYLFMYQRKSSRTTYHLAFYC